MSAAALANAGLSAGVGLPLALATILVPAALGARDQSVSALHWPIGRANQPI